MKQQIGFQVVLLITTLSVKNSLWSQQPLPCIEVQVLVAFVHNAASIRVTVIYKRKIWLWK